MKQTIARFATTVMLLYFTIAALGRSGNLWEALGMAAMLYIFWLLGTLSVREKNT